MRFITRTVAIVSLCLSTIFTIAFAQDAASAASKSDVAEPAPRSIMLPPVAAKPVKPAPPPAAPDAPDADNVQQLDGVTVEGKRDALSKSDQHLKDVIGKLPCNGCDTKTKKIEEKRSFTEKALKAVADQCCIPTHPPEETEANELDRQLTQQIITPTNSRP